MKRLLAVLLACGGMAVAQLQMLSPEYGTNGAPMSSFLNTSYLTQQVMNDGAFKKGFSGGSKTVPNDAPPVTFRDGGRPPTIPAKLAQVYPAAKRAEVERVFTSVLVDLYPKVEKYIGVPHNDLAGAVATFLVGSYQAASSDDVKDADVKTLVAQLRGMMATNSGIAKAPDAAKQEMYEQMAVLGGFLLGVEEALQKAPNPQIAANLKKSGEDYLRTFLGVDPAQVKIGATGMTLTNTNSSLPPAHVPAVGDSRTAIPSAASRLTDSIETIGFYSKVGYGYGGMMTFNPTPIVLFKSGEALYDMEALKFADGLAAHKAAHPKDWTKWRRGGSAIEVVGSKGWERLTYTKTMDRLPSGYSLTGDYQRLSGSGNLAVGGTSAVAVWSNLSFDRAGNFDSGGGSSSSTRSEVGGSTSSVVASGRAAKQQGSYAIEGYSLTLHYSDGRTERRMIVADQTDPGVIWLDGEGYTKN